MRRSQVRILLGSLERAVRPKGQLFGNNNIHQATLEWILLFLDSTSDSACNRFLTSEPERSFHPASAKRTLEQIFLFGGSLNASEEIAF
ncbi:MAG: hypothetical protein DA408_20480 [Bacteroidetes bacterium]|nr:MAG: hypothetical protein C7N36_08870 [Bacteroidota bacterium]PTM08471.1 MAG: hypothetical protein DA408_20480 [Bacteroidota bacterium]